MKKRKYWSMTRAALHAGVTEVTVRRAARLGVLEAEKIEGRWLTWEAAVDAWIAADVHTRGKKKGT